MNERIIWGFSRFTDYALVIIPLASASKKHDQPNCLGRDENRKKKEAGEQVNMVSKMQKKQDCQTIKNADV